MRRPIQVLVYSARRGDADWEYLLLHRTPWGDGFWQGVTGGVEGDETPLAAAYRELQEETGFTPERLEDLDFSYTFPVADRWRYLYAPGVDEIREHVYLAEVASGADPAIDRREHDDWRWCTLEAATSLLIWPDNVNGLRRAAAWLRRRESGGI
jgi:8-oxo-dGTP pyrophosphatase MutT (NUDIX family)